MENNSKNKNKIVIVVSCLLLVIAGTFAYFVARIGSGAQGDVKINANSMDDLKFEVNKDISLSIDQYNFASGAGNLSDEATAKAMLKANSTKNTATYNYYVYFYVTTNTYVYSTSDKKPEIVLTVTDPNGAEVTSIEGLNYVSATNADGTVVKGFDITTYKGVVKVADNHEITSDSSTNYTNQEWNFKVTFINLDTNQLANEDKSLKGEVLIQKVEKKPTLAQYVISQYTGTQGANNLYYHDSTLTNGAGDNSYRYAGSSETTNNFVCFGYDSTDGTCPTDNLYRIIGVFDNQVKLIKYDYAKATLLGTDGDYHNTYKNWEGSSTYGTNKGSNAKTEIGVYYWNYKADTSNYNNTWSNSLLNKTNLNTNYLNNIGTSWSNRIATHTWKVGGNTYNNIASVIAPNIYKNEITTPAENTTYDAKVGLMYVSDYGYAAAPSAWTTPLYNGNGNDYRLSSVTSVNWMYMGLYDWTIARRSDYSDSVFNVHFVGHVGYNYVRYGRYAVRPVLYLASETAYAGGTGNAGSPILIK